MKLHHTVTEMSAALRLHKLFPFRYDVFLGYSTVVLKSGVMHTVVWPSHLYAIRFGPLTSKRYNTTANAFLFTFTESKVCFTGTGWTAERVVPIVAGHRQRWKPVFTTEKIHSYLVPHNFDFSILKCYNKFTTCHLTIYIIITTCYLTYSLVFKL